MVPPVPGLLPQHAFPPLPSCKRPVPSWCQSLPPAQTGEGATRLPAARGGAQSVSLAGKRDAVVEKTPAAVRVPPPVSAPAQCRGRARDARQDACGSGRVTRMDHGVEGLGDTCAVGQALWTARPHDVAKSEGARVSGHRAHR